MDWSDWDWYWALWWVRVGHNKWVRWCWVRTRVNIIHGKRVRVYRLPDFEYSPEIM